MNKAFQKVNGKQLDREKVTKASIKMKEEAIDHIPPRVK